MVEEPIQKKYLVVSLHDVTPHSEKIYRPFLTEMEELGLLTTTLLVVPNFHDEYPIAEYPEFLDWLRTMQNRNHEICLHGYSHKAKIVTGGWISKGMGRIYTAGEGEFYQLNYDQAKTRITNGLEMFHSLHLETKGFVAPAWLLSRGSREAIRDSELLYTTTLQHLDFLQTNKTVYAPTLVFSSRNRWRRFVSKKWVSFWSSLNRSAKIIRIAVHPDDLKYPEIRFMIRSCIAQLLNKRQLVTYTHLANLSNHL